MAFQKKSTTATEAVVGAASAELKKSVAGLEAATAHLKGLTDTLEAQQLKIAASEDKLKELDVQLVEKIRQHKVEFDLKVKEDETKMVKEILGSQHLVAVSEGEFESLKKELQDLETDFDQQVEADVKKATGGIAQTFKHKEELLLAEHRAERAADVAEITNLKAMNASLTAQVNMWKDALDLERQASIERSKASAVGSVIIGDSSGGKR